MITTLKDAHMSTVKPRSFISKRQEIFFLTIQNTFWLPDLLQNPLIMISSFYF
jgi:hypothetical protein